MTMYRYDPTKWLAAALLVSFGIHAGYIFSRQNSARQHVENKPIEMMIVEVKPPEPPKPPEPEPEKPKPEPPKPKIIAKAPVVKPPPDAPPPPTQEAPKETPSKVVPVVIGISMDSTSAVGGAAVPVGNTTMGITPKKAVEPSSVQAYRAPKYVPPGGADSDPSVEGDVKIEYPPEAKKAGVEGTVRLRVVVDNEGHVVDVKVLSGLGYGLDEAAREALKRFKFKPAMKAGEAVSTTITYNYTFVLD